MGLNVTFQEYSSAVKSAEEIMGKYAQQKQEEKGFQLLRPYLSLAELEADVDALGDYRDPAEFQKYLAILFRLMAYTSSCSFKISDVEINGKRGEFLGHYSNEVMRAACRICSRKFPGEDVYGSSDYSTSLFPTGDGALSFYGVRALGSSVAAPLGLNALAEKSDFIKQWQIENPCYMNCEITWAELEALELEARLYLQNLNRTQMESTDGFSGKGLK